MLIATTDNFVKQLTTNGRIVAMHGIIVDAFIFIVTILFITMFRVMKQLTSDPTTLFQHKLIKWLYMVSLVVNGTIGLGIIVTGGLALAELLQGDNQQWPIPVQINLGIMFLIAVLCTLIMAWVLPTCDKLLTELKKG